VRGLHPVGPYQGPTGLIILASFIALDRLHSGVPTYEVGMVNPDINLQESRLQPDRAFPAGTHRLKQLAW
jgi:hypothetical protein